MPSGTTKYFLALITRPWRHMVARGAGCGRVELDRRFSVVKALASGSFGVD